MALTLSDVKTGVLGDLRYRVMDVTFDSSYPTGGESLTAADLGWDSIIELKARSTTNGYEFSYDYTNHLLKAERSTPALIVEESVTVTSNVGALANIPAYIVAVTISTTVGLHVVPSTVTPVTGQVAVNFTTGAVTFAAADNVTTALVTYFPRKRGTLFDTPTVNESVVASASKVNLAARAAMVQYVYDSTDGVIDVIVPSGEAPAATHQASIDINDSGNTSIDTHADDDGNTLLVTYIPYSYLTDPSMFLDDTDISSDFEPYNFTGTGNYNALVVPGLGTHLVGEEADATNRDIPFGGPSRTATNGTLAVWNPSTNTVTAAQTTNLATVSIPWILMGPSNMGNSLNEVPAGTNLAAITVRMFALGW